MPPYPYLFEGIDVIGPLLDGRVCARASGGCSPTGPTGCRPPRATCARPGDTEFRAFKFDVLRVEHGKIAEITTFGPELFGVFGLPATVPG